jgi:hypothetical protein
VAFGLDMNQVGVLEGTDKSSSVSFRWDYLKHYEEWFSPWKHEEINVIEIGVANGNSLPVWEDFFSKARIVGIDINPHCARFANGRVSIEIGSQEDPAFLQRVCAKYQPTIIIDDGSHQAHHIIYTFEHMFPNLLPGGIYIVEDLAFHLGGDTKAWARVEGYNAPQYFLDLANICMSRHNREELWGTRRNIVQTTESVRFINSAVCILKKKLEKRPVNLEAAKQYLLQRSLHTSGLLRYAQYMYENGHDVGPLISQLRDFESSGADVDFFKGLAELQRAQGQVRDAIETLARGSELFADSHEMLWRYGHRLIEAGRCKDGLQILGRAATVCRNLGELEPILNMTLQYARSANETELGTEVLRAAAEKSPSQDCRRALLDAEASLSR